MGFHHATGQNVATWASFADGKIVLRSRDPREGFVARVNKIGNTVYEQRHEAFTGRLQNIRMTDNDYGSQFCFNFVDGDDTYIITDRMDGSYARAVISYLASDAFDPVKPVTLVPWKMADKNDPDKYFVGCKVTQADKELPRRWVSHRVPEDKRNGAQPFPEMAMVKVNGKMTPDATPIIELLCKAAEEITAKCEKSAYIQDTSAYASPKPVRTSIAEVREAATSADVPDGLPF